MVTAILVHSQWGGGGWGMGPGMMGGYGMGYGMGWFGFIIMVVFWIAVIVGIFALIRWLIVSSRPRAEGRGEETPLEILKKRYARGEINREEFEEKKKDLL
jgi:putative membrane protein